MQDFIGGVRMRNKKRLSPVNRQGFASLYALVILQLITVFCVLAFHTCSTLMVLDKQDDSLHQAQLFAIYRIKARLVQQTAKEDTTWEEEGEEMEEQPSQSKKEEQAFYAGHTIQLEYEEVIVHVQIEDFQFQVLIDPDSSSILDLVYL